MKTRYLGLATVPRRVAAATAELAILLPFLGLAFIAAADFARSFHYSQVVQECARSGALLASGAAYRPNGSAPEDAALQAAVATGATLYPPVQNENVAVTFDGNSATVTVTYPFQALVAFPGLPSVTTLTRTVTLPISPLDPRWN